MTGPSRRGPTRPPLPHHPSVALQRRCFDECEAAGWDPDRRLSFAEEIAHLHDEISEAFRAYRERLDFAITYGDCGKPGGVPIEFADVLIGLFYNAELHGFDLLQALEIKHAWNLSRSYEAEGRQLHRQLAPRDAVVDAAIAEHRAHQTATRLARNALTAPHGAPAVTAYNQATEAAVAAHRALRAAVEHLLTTTEAPR